jgi:hypothetical protein
LADIGILGDPSSENNPDDCLTGVDPTKPDFWPLGVGPEDGSMKNPWSLALVLNLRHWWEEQAMRVDRLEVA